MEVIRSRHTGFCFGVKRAVDRVLKEITMRGGEVYTIGPIIHNPQMVRALMEKGVVPIEDVRSVESGTVVYRTHGISKEDEEYVAAKGLRAIDVICPFVKRVRQSAVRLRREGYRVVLVGDQYHPEIKSVLSYLDNDAIVLDAPASVHAKKVGVVSQTTFDNETFVRVVSALLVETEELRAYNTICKSTETRQGEAAGLAKTVDVMIVVGGRDSSNTKKLYAIARQWQPNTYHVETEEALREEWFSNAHTVGIAGGSSTPEHIIDSVDRRVKNF
jgi:(E)-4-hydroxy-3-methyl-but-2-enyl pyrophosphate reductase